MSRMQRVLGQLESKVGSVSGSGVSGKDGSGPLDAERSNPSFSVRSMTYFLDGGKEITAMREMVAQTLADDDILVDKNREDWSREEKRRRTMQKILQISNIVRMRSDNESEEENKPVDENDKKSARAGVSRSFEDAFYGALSSHDPSWAIRIGVHYGLFAGAINSQASAEQKKLLSKKTQEMRIYGCFAMTELGHGSYVRGLETTATFDIFKQQFIINTPTLTATKWWIGGAAHTATHSVVYARLLLPTAEIEAYRKGARSRSGSGSMPTGPFKDMGIQSFLVPLRCLKSGRVFDGIEIGDCGAKYGRDGLDNGWLRFNNVRVGRKDMLTRWSKVLEDGTFVQPPSKQMAYGALVGTRVELLRISSQEARKALTIAIRYSALRKQGADPNGGVGPDGRPREMVVLDYPTQQMRLLPLLAGAFAWHFASEGTRIMYEEMNSQLEDSSKRDSALKLLQAVHATSAGLKAHATWFTDFVIEECRQCLGGHGYSKYCGLTGMRADWAVMCSWEGDNTVMALQTGRYLMRQCHSLGLAESAKAQSGHSVNPVVEYLTRDNCEWATKVTNGDLTPGKLFSSLDGICAMFSARAASVVANCAKVVLRDPLYHAKPDVAMQKHGVLLFRAAKAHCELFVVDRFVSETRRAPKKLQPILTLLVRLYAAWLVDRSLGEFVNSSILKTGSGISLIALMTQLCGQLRKDAVPLVDSFGFADFLLNSPFGRYDGNVYEHYFKRVKAAPRSQGIPEYFNDFIKPLTDPDFEE